MKYYHPEADFLRKYNIPSPETISHGTELDVQDKLKAPDILSWRLEGNRLIAETEMGPIVNLIPSDRIMTGLDDKGLPILAKIG